MAHVAQLAAEAAASRLPPAPARLNVGPAPEMTQREKLTAQALAAIRAGDDADVVAAKPGSPAPAAPAPAPAPAARPRPAPQPQAVPQPPPAPASPAAAGRSSLGARLAADLPFLQGVPDQALVAGAAGGCVLLLALFRALLRGGSRQDSAKAGPRHSSGATAPGSSLGRGEVVARHAVRNPFGPSSELGASAFEGEDNELGDAHAPGDVAWDLEEEAHEVGDLHPGRAAGRPGGLSAVQAGGRGSWGGPAHSAAWPHGAHSDSLGPGHDGMPCSVRGGCPGACRLVLRVRCWLFWPPTPQVGRRTHTRSFCAPLTQLTSLSTSTAAHELRGGAAGGSGPGGVLRPPGGALSSQHAVEDRLLHPQRERSPAALRRPEAEPGCSGGGPLRRLTACGGWPHRPL